MMKTICTARAFQTSCVLIKPKPMKYIGALSTNKQRYVDLLRDDACRILMVQSPPGTGKTFHAVEEGINHLEERTYDQLIFTRPMIPTDETENIGYLPGNESSKIGIYYQHIMDILTELLVPKKLENYIENSKIKFMPLGFIRGRTFKNSYIVGDEFQNASPHIMRTFLTRIGENTKMVITGDVSQTDTQLPVSGLEDFITRLDRHTHLDTIKSIEMGLDDIIRDPIVGDILNVYNSVGTEPSPASVSEYFPILSTKTKKVGNTDSTNLRSFFDTN